MIIVRYVLCSGSEYECNNAAVTRHGHTCSIWHGSSRRRGSRRRRTRDGYKSRKRWRFYGFNILISVTGADKTKRTVGQRNRAVYVTCVLLSFRISAGNVTVSGPERRVPRPTATVDIHRQFIDGTSALYCAFSTPTFTTGICWHARFFFFEKNFKRRHFGSCELHVFASWSNGLHYA